MSFFAESMVNRPVSGSEFGLIVRPIGSGPNGSVPVSISGQGDSGAVNVNVVSGSITMSTATVIVPPMTNPNSASLAIVAQTTSVTQLLPSDNNRSGMHIFNESDSLLKVYHGSNNTGSSDYSFSIGPRLIYESADLVFAGALYGAWSISGSGQARVTSYSAIQQTSASITVSGTMNQGARGARTQPWYVAPPDYGLSSFGEQRVSQPLTLLNLVNKYGVDTKIVSTSSSLSASVTNDMSKSAIRLSVSGSVGARARMRTKQYFLYQPGHGQRILMSAYHTEVAPPGQVRRWGYYDDEDGVFFCSSGSQFGVVTRSSTSGVAVDTFVSSSDFSVDKCDGTGPDAFTLDVTKGNIYEVGFQWLGAGTVRWYVSGRLVHEDYHGNTLQGPYTKTMDLPVSAGIQNLSSSESGSFNVICCTVQSENGTNIPSYTLSTGSLVTTTTNASELGILSVRLKDLFSGVKNRGYIYPKSLGIYLENNNDAIFRLRLNSQLTGSMTWSSPSEFSILEASSNTVTVNNGVDLLGPIYAHGPTSLIIDLENVFPHEPATRLLTIDPFTLVSDYVTVTVQRYGAGNTTCLASLAWQEHR